MPRRLARRSQEPKPEDDPQPKLMEWRPTPMLYDVTDTCFILGKISKQMIYRLIHLHQLMPVHIGKRSLFTPEELERFVATLVAEAQAQQAG